MYTGIIFKRSIGYTTVIVTITAMILTAFRSLGSPIRFQSMQYINGNASVTGMETVRF
jgi:hypothetical protein